mmetsp:Transcript_3296/g.13560  ORF Transcript_3296/g.13560 Transcript_3296/m.13560 type:complete len:201 (+) Transcript_3296:556-1158(+)
MAARAALQRRVRGRVVAGAGGSHGALVEDHVGKLQPPLVPRGRRQQRRVPRQRDGGRPALGDALLHCREQDTGVLVPRPRQHGHPALCAGCAVDAVAAARHAPQREGRARATVAGGGVASQRLLRALLAQRAAELRVGVEREPGRAEAADARAVGDLKGRRAVRHRDGHALAGPLERLVAQERHEGRRPRQRGLHRHARD